MSLTKCREALLARGYRVSVHQTAKEAAEYLNAQIDGVSVGVGGSMTVREMGLCESLAAHNTVYNHWEPPAGMTAREVQAAAATAEVYLSSVNALSLDGVIVNMDGACNRVAGTLFGHKRVYFIVGSNKLAKDEAAAVFRTRNVAAPKNAARLGRATPCASAGKCMDCTSPERICRALLTLYGPPMGGEYEVVLVDEPLGY